MLTNKTKLSEAEAHKAVLDILSDPDVAGDLRVRLVEFFSEWALAENKGPEIEALAHEFKTVIIAVLEAKKVDGRVALLALDFLVDRFAVAFAVEHGHVQIRPVEEKEHGGKDDNGQYVA